MFQKIKSLIYTNNVLEEKAFAVLFAVSLRIGLECAMYCDTLILDLFCNYQLFSSSHSPGQKVGKKFKRELNVVELLLQTCQPLLYHVLPAVDVADDLVDGVLSLK